MSLERHESLPRSRMTVAIALPMPTPIGALTALGRVGDQARGRSEHLANRVDADATLALVALRRIRERRQHRIEAHAT